MLGLGGPVVDSALPVQIRSLAIPHAMRPEEKKKKMVPLLKLPGRGGWLLLTVMLGHWGAAGVTLIKPLSLWVISGS